MNQRIQELAKQAGFGLHRDGEIYTSRLEHLPITEDIEKFAESIIEECRNVVADVYRNTPLELCGPLLTADEEIAKHFYGVEE